jgi:hypothetical protein
MNRLASNRDPPDLCLPSSYICHVASGKLDRTLVKASDQRDNVLVGFFFCFFLFFFSTGV